MKRLILLFLPSVLFFSVSQNCSKKSDPTPPAAAAAVPTYPDIKKYFDVGYVAAESFQDLDTTKVVADGNPALVIKDVIGKKHLYFKGVTSGALSPMWPTPPFFHLEDKAGSKTNSYGYGYILVPNVLNAYWQSNTFTPMPQPYDVYMVLRDFECVLYEAYNAGGIGVRNRGTHLGMGLDDYKGGPNGTTQVDFADATPPAIVNYNTITIMRVHVEGTSTAIWLNNKQIPGSVDIGTGQINLLGYGTPSHAAQHDFFSMWVKFGTISAADNTTIYQALSDFYQPATYPDYPLADSIRVAWNNGTTAATKGWTAKYAYKGANPEDKTKTTYQWGYWVQATSDVGTASLLTGDKSKNQTLIRSDYSSIFAVLNTTQVFVIVKVFDTKGNSWEHLVRSQMLTDNIP